jgi:hypothetical protein
MISAFFIRNPVFAGVLSIIIFLVGLVSMTNLPIEQYPKVLPPQIVVSTNYPGASANTIAKTVAAPLEQQINGAKDMIYMNSLEEQNIENLSKDFEVITIATQSGSNEEIEKYLKDKNLSFKVVNDEYGLLSTEFNVKAFPTTFIYDKNKNLKFTEVGYTSTFGLKLRLWWSSF